MAIIEKTDIYSGGDPFAAIAEGLKALTDAEKLLIEQNEKLIQSYSKIKSDNSGDEAKKRAEETQKLADTNQQLNEVQKLRLKIEQQLHTAEKNKAIKDEIKLEQALKVTVDTQANSIEQLQKVNAALVLQRKKLNLTTKEGAEEYRKLTAAIKANEDRLKTFDAEIGRHQKNVGNYKADMKAAISETGLFGSVMATFSDIGARASAGINLVKTAFGTLKGAILSTGIGALVIAFGSLLTYFTQTNEGSKLLKQAFAGIGAVVDVLIKSFAGFGKTILEVFTKPKESFDKFVDFLKTNVFPVFDSLGTLLAGVFTFNADKISKGAAGIQKAFADIAKNVSNYVGELKGAALAGIEYEKGLQKLADGERKLLILRKNTDRQVNERKKLTKEGLKTSEENLQLIEEAIKFEEAYANTALNLANQRLQILRTFFATKSELTEEDKNQLAEAEANIYEIQSNNSEKLESLYTERAGFQNEVAKNLASNQERIANESVNNISNIQLTALKTEQQINDEKLAQSQSLQDSILKGVQDRANAELELERAKAKATEEILYNAAGTAMQLFEKNTIAYKALASFQIGIDTRNAAMSAYAAAAKIDPFILAPLAAGLAIAFGLKQLADVNNVQIPKFAEGGEIGGRKHSEGGTMIEAEKEACTLFDESQQKIEREAGYGHNMCRIKRISAPEPNVYEQLIVNKFQAEGFEVFIDWVEIPGTGHTNYDDGGYWCDHNYYIAVSW